MKITQTRDNDHLTIAVSGEIEAVNADELEQSVLGSLDGVNDLTLDLKDLEYIASAGLRVILQAKKALLRLSDIKKDYDSDIICKHKPATFPSVLHREDCSTS